MDFTLLIAPLAGLAGTFLGAWLVDHFSGHRWLAQQQWSERQKRYVELLAHLTRARMSLESRSEWFIEPGSEYRDVSGDLAYAALMRKTGESLQQAEELTGAARMFLSPSAISALEHLARENWHAGYGSCGDECEYVTKALELVKSAESEVLSAAKAELQYGN